MPLRTDDGLEHLARHRLWQQPAQQQPGMVQILAATTAAAVAAAEPMARMASFERQAVLAHCVKRFTERADELAQALCIEAGKPILMLPRLQAMGEHNTDHQLATAKHVGIRPGLHVAADGDDLKARASALLADTGTAPAPISRFADPAFTAHIRAFIES